ncbi:hypothetical protein [Methylobacterium nigriterrae]|uniref:hypothetical protein n=1 Tax=Methylobacterium nigriterrae TaxID=3127512 RepID=UPI003013ACDD
MVPDPAARDRPHAPDFPLPSGGEAALIVIEFEAAAQDHGRRLPASAQVHGGVP